MIADRPVTLATSDGIALEGRVAMPAAPRGGMVICHPHPLYGGDLDNPVVVRAAAVAFDLGLATLRFNFRGVGRSTGVHGGGEAEHGDVRAAVDHLETLLPGGVPLLLVGYSFGATVAARAATTGGLAGLALIAPPLGLAAHAGLPALPGPLAVLVVAGSLDEYCRPDALDRLRTDLSRVNVQVIEGANHFFFGKLHPLGETLHAWARAVLSGCP